MNKIIFLFLGISLASCNSVSKKSNGPDIVDILSALKNQKEIKISQFVDDIEYIRLEETDQSMLFYPLITVTDDFIIARNSGFSAMGPILLFDIETGKFIRGIGKSGRGPEEFYLGSNLYNIYSKTIYALGYNNDIKEYDLEGEFRGSFKLPVMIDEKVDPKFGTPHIYLSQYLKADLFVSNIVNFTGWDKRRIILFTRDSIVKIFPNYLFWERKNWRGGNSIGMNPNYFRWNNQLFFKDEFNDTVFQITESSLIPMFVFDVGENNPKPEIMEQTTNINELRAKYYFVKNISENNDYLFFQLQFDNNTFTGFFDKKYKITNICKIEENNKSSFVDDINGFMSIRPQEITQNNEIIFTLNPEEITNWIKDNPEKTLKLYSKLDWLKSYSPTSNPVIVIARCR